MKRLLLLFSGFLLWQFALPAQNAVNQILDYGWEQFAEGNYQEALDACEDALSINPNVVGAFVLRGCIHSYNERTKLAMPDLNYAIQQGTKDHRAYLYRAFVFQLTEQYEYSERDFKTAISMDGKDWRAYTMRGMMRVHAAKYAEALEDLNKALRLSPDNPSVLFTLGYAYYEQKEYAKGLATFKRVKEIGNFKVLDTELYLGICAHRMGMYSAAETHFMNATEIDSQSSLAWYDLGTIKQAQKDYAAAQGNFDKSIALDRVNPDAYAHKAECWMFTEDYAPAILSLDTAITFGGDFLKYNYIMRGNAKYNLERYDAAIADYNLALAQDPKLANALYRRGRALIKLKRFSDAKADLLAVGKLDPGNEDAKFYLAMSYANTGDNETPRTIYKNYLQKFPEDTGAWNNMACAEGALGLCADAVAHYAKALATRNKDSVTVYHDRVECLLQLGDTLAANASLDSSLALRPKTGHLLSGIGYLLNCTNRFEEALPVLNRAIALDSTLAYAFNNRGFAKYKLGQYESAILDFNQSIVLKNDYRHWPPYNRANCLRALGRYKEAIADFDLALSYVEDYPEAYNDRGETWEKLGDKEKAIADYRKALSHKPDFARAQQNLDRLLR